MSTTIASALVPSTVASADAAGSVHERIAPRSHWIPSSDRGSSDSSAPGASVTVTSRYRNWMSTEGAARDAARGPAGPAEGSVPTAQAGSRPPGRRQAPGQPVDLARPKRLQLFGVVQVVRHGDVRLGPDEGCLAKSRDQRVEGGSGGQSAIRPAMVVRQQDRYRIQPRDTGVVAGLDQCTGTRDLDLSPQQVLRLGLVTESGQRLQDGAVTAFEQAIVHERDQVQIEMLGLGHPASRDSARASARRRKTVASGCSWEPQVRSAIACA